MAKIAILGDLHFGARGDSETFARHIFSFLNNTFFPYLENHKIDKCVSVGDVMDRRKFINFKTLADVKANFFTKFEELKIPFHVIPGNHDTYYRNSNSLSSIFELFHANEYKYTHIYMEPTSIELDKGFCVDMIPWINKENYDETVKFMKGTSSPVCFGHFAIEGFEMSAGITTFGGMKRSLFRNYEQVYSGHYHHKSSDGNIMYVGTPYDLTWSDYGDIKGFHILDTNTNELVFVENPETKHFKIFFDSTCPPKKFNFDQFNDKIVKLVIKDRTDIKATDEFQDNLHAVSPFDVTVIDSDVGVLDDIAIDEVSEEDTLNMFLIAAQEKVKNTKRLNGKVMTKLVTEIYDEALSQGE